MINILKLYVQPIFQYGCLLFGTASKSHLGFSKDRETIPSENFLGLMRSHEVRTYRKKYSILWRYELNVNELFKLLCKIVRRENSFLVNNIISTSDIQRCLYDQRPKSLTTKYIMTTGNKKRTETRIRILFNSIFYLDREIM